MLTLASPAISPEFVNSVICCGNSEPPGFLFRSYQPKPFVVFQSSAKPWIDVDSARSAEHASTSGRPIASFACALTHAPNFAKPSLFAIFVPGAT
jgi:hypothetical protein